MVHGTSIIIGTRRSNKLTADDHRLSRLIKSSFNHRTTCTANTAACHSVMRKPRIAEDAQPLSQVYPTRVSTTLTCRARTEDCRGALNSWTKRRTSGHGTQAKTWSTTQRGPGTVVDSFARDRPDVLQAYAIPPRRGTLTKPPSQP